MEKAVCPHCGGKLVVDKCLSEKDAVMKCRHCKRALMSLLMKKHFQPNSILSIGVHS